MFSTFGFVSFANVSLFAIRYFVCQYLFCFLIMTTERDDLLQYVNVRLDGKNSLYWSYLMRNFLKGKKLWGYVTRTCVKPKSTDQNYVNDTDTWEVNNAKIITWINNSIEHSIGTQLAKYKTTKENWDHLKMLYSQSNFESSII